MQHKLIEFLNSDKPQQSFIVQEYGRNDTLDVIKFNHDENNIFLYTRCIHENDLMHGKNFEYAGFYNLKSNKLYDLSYEMRSFLKIDHFNNDIISYEKIVSDIKSLVLEEVKNIINNDVKNIDTSQAEKELDEYDKKYLSDYPIYYAKTEAEDYFIKNKTLEDIKIHIPQIQNVYTSDVLSHLNGDSKALINSKAITHIAENLKKIYKSFLCTEMTRKEFLKISNDKTNILHLKRAISNSITDQKTVNVTILKDGKEFTFKTKTDALKCGVYNNYYYSWDIQSSDRKKFEKLFGRSADYKADEIMKIVYCKKPLYIKEVA